MKRKKILISPLDWGLGHASRCIPIIRKLLKNNFEVIIGGNGRSFQMLKLEFPQLEFLDISGYSIKYPKNKNMVWKMMLSISNILKGISKEHKTLANIIKEKNIDIIISDNRYGLWNKSAYSVFITHQLFIKCPKYISFAEPILLLINKYFIKKFDECWIPDVEDENNFSGELSHKNKSFENIHFIGVLSRFENSKQINSEIKYDIVSVISGPEPQRTIFEKIITSQLKKSKLKSLIIQGKTGEISKFSLNKNIEIVSHLETAEFENVLKSAKLIISRAGYSSIMDYATLGIKAILIPTPGQTEQEYLAEFHKSKRNFYSVSQDKFNLQQAIEESEKYNESKRSLNSIELDKQISVLLNNINQT